MKNHLIQLLSVILAILLCSCVQTENHETTLPGTQPEAETTVQTVPVTFAPTDPATETVTEPSVTTEPPTEPEPAAEIIQDGVRVLVDGVDYAVALSDDNHYSKKYIYAYQETSVESEVPFCSLYIEWDKAPEEYTIIWENGSIDCGQYGFLHEYVRLPEEVTRVQFIFGEGKMHLLCDIEVLTGGTAPEGTQEWLPPCEEADILVFPTHADDDVLFFGPLMSHYAVERQLDVQTAFMVDHSFYPERGHERLNGLWEMGIRHYPVLGTAQDSPIFNFNEAMAFYASSNIEHWQVEQIRTFKPLVVVGHDLDGEYGNGGHKVNAYYLTCAIEAAADPEKYPELAATYGTWDTPKLYLHLYPENEILIDVETPMDNDPEGRTPFSAATDAYKWHVSQHTWPYRVQFGEDPDFDCRPFGLYRTLVGNDTEADIMDNIDEVCWRSSHTHP